MKRRILALLLPLAMLLTFGAQAVADDVPHNDPPGVYRTMASEDTPLFPPARIYEDQFVDVPLGSWYYPYVASGYAYGLFEGRGDGFEPDGDITVAELLTLSARLRAAYDGDTIRERAEGELWYMPYVSYLDGKDILERSLETLDVPATRAQLAAIFALSLPESCYDGLNDSITAQGYASGGYITDVGEDTPYQAQILWLYRQGLLKGMDDTGSYWPDNTTTRAETAALVMRMVIPSLRVTLDWQIAPSWSVAGVTFADLVAAPESVDAAPSYRDTAAIDALVRRMLAAGGNTIELEYPRPITNSDAKTLAQVFSDQVKYYCEQMYNSVECQYYLNSGYVVLSFYATACLPGEGIAENSRAREQLMEIAAAKLAQYRNEALAKAVEVHNQLWESGQLTEGMSQREVARVYYKWLCEHCKYDSRAMDDDYSLSHIGYSALIDGKAVCDGYTGAYNLFLKLEGIECHALSNSTHIWTVATLDGTEYHIDVTWGDQESYVEWDFFGMSEAASRRAHPW